MRDRCFRLEEEAFANSIEELEHENDDLVQAGRLESGEELRNPGWADRREKLCTKSLVAKNNTVSDRREGNNEG